MLACELRAGIERDRTGQGRSGERAPASDRGIPGRLDAGGCSRTTTGSIASPLQLAAQTLLAADFRWCGPVVPGRPIGRWGAWTRPGPVRSDHLEAVRRPWGRRGLVIARELLPRIVAGMAGRAPRPERATTAPFEVSRGRSGGVPGRRLGAGAEPPADPRPIPTGVRGRLTRNPRRRRCFKASGGRRGRGLRTSRRWAAPPRGRPPGSGSVRGGRRRTTPRTGAGGLRATSARRPASRREALRP